MRFTNRYKNLTNTVAFFKQSSARVLKFKRPKWKKFQTVLKLKLNSPTIFIDNSIVKTNYKNWEKLKLHYKEGIQAKKALLNFFDNSISSTHYKKNLLVPSTKLGVSAMSAFFIKPMFKLDILLWKLGLFNSPFESRQSIQNGLIDVNNKTLTESTSLKLGDVVSLSSKINLKQYNSKRIFDNAFLFSFLEIDYYAGTFIIIKSVDQISKEDISTLIFDSINLKAFNDYVIRN